MARSRAPWRVGGPTSLLLLDLAAGRTYEHQGSLTSSQMELAVRHGLIGLIADSRESLLRDAVLPVFARLQARQQIMERHLRRLLETFAEAEIRATVLKGPHLARSAYVNPTHRTYTDLDILVRRDDLERSLEALRADPAVSSIPPQTPKADKRHIPMVDDSGVMFTVDLHWDLFSYSQLRGCADGATDWAWSEARLEPDHALGPLWELPPETYLAFLTTHATLDHRFRLILFRDLAEVAGRGIDWGRFLDFIGKYRLRSPAYLSFLIASNALDAAVETEVLEEIRPRYQLLRWTERALARTDLVRFEGHSVRALNLGIVLTHDDPNTRLRLALAAPIAFPRWQRRIERESPRRDRRVLVLVASNQRRGAEVNGERLASGLTALGWDVDFMALFDGREPARVQAEALARSRPYRRFNLRVVAALRRHVAETRPGIVFANGGATLRYALAAVSALRHRPKLVYGSIGQPSYWLRSERHASIQRLLHARADRILAVADLTRSELIDIMRYDPDRIDVVHVGVPESFFIDHPRRDGGPLRLLFLGALSPEKDPLAALKVVARLPDARVRFVGTGPEQSRLEESVKQSDLEDRVEVVGSVDDVLPHLAWADLLILTSQTEGFPGVVLEAAAAGVPTVGFDVGGVAETVIDRNTGLVVSAGDVDGMVRVFESLDRQDIAEMAARGRARVEAEFTMERTLDRHIEAFRRVLAEEQA
jgi:glycosyltransferase involved in cell wall biosynthesis